LGGASAGAASVVLQLTAYGGRDDKLFQAAAAESQAFPPIRNVTDNQWAYDALLKRTGCQNITCLKSLDAVSFQNAVRNFKPSFPGGKSAPLFFWNPTLDYDFIKDYTYNEVNAGHFVKVPTIFGDTTHEGLGFTPVSTNSLQSAMQFVVNQFPNLDKKDFSRVLDEWSPPINIQHDPKWRDFASDVYGHIRYICPGLNISHAYAENGTVPTWQYRWNVGRALHVEELGPIWNNGSTPARVFMQSYMASFIRSYDPNKHVAEYLLSSGTELTSPDWTVFGDGNGKRLLFDNEDDVSMEAVSQEERDKCDLITELGIQLEQ
jgi:carboxylesterase type B